MRWPLAVLAVGVVLAALIAAGPGTAAPSVSEERIDRAVGFLRAAQNSDGGFGEAGSSSDPTLSAWVALALDAAGINAVSLRRGPTTLGAYLERQEPELATDIELQLLARAALGLDGAELVAALRAQMRPSGRIGPRLNATIWGILALRAAGEPVPKRAVRYVRRHQHRGGGFSFVAKGPPDTNDTAAAIQALRAAGFRARSKPIKRALRYLAKARKGSGGYPLIPGKSADAQSTGWVLQAHAAAKRGAPPRAKRYLVRLQQTDGSLHYRKGQDLMPVWVTAQALPGLLDAPFSSLAG
jgi:hypothetical protein